MERRKTGRPSLGPRKRKPLQLPIPLAEAAEAEAKRYGMNFNDLIGRLVSDHLREQGVDVDKLMNQARTNEQRPEGAVQQELPLAG